MALMHIERLACTRLAWMILIILDGFSDAQKPETRIYLVGFIAIERGRIADSSC